MKKVLLMFTLCATVFTACDLIGLEGESSNGDQLEIPLTRAQVEYVKTGNNTFAINLFKAVAKDNDLVISPLSVTFALGMVDNGAEGDTKAQIEKALGYEDDSVDGLNSFCNTIIENADKLDKLSTVELANAIVVNNGRGKLSDEFVGVVGKDYQAEFFNLDFAKDDITGQVNKWCQEHTHGKIQSLLDVSPSNDSYLYALNALYFKSPWTNVFPGTITEGFTDIHNKSVSKEMMHQVNTFKYGSVPGCCSAVSLPFGNQVYSMLFLLPEEGKTLSDLKETLDSKTWDKMRKSLKDAKVDVKIPLFATSCTLPLKEALNKLGIANAFIPALSEFGLMSKEEMPWIQDVLQKARIIVTTDGVEAVSVTSVQMGGLTGMPPKPEKIFHADRPFIYAITEVSTGAIFFIGQYTGR